MPTRRQPKSLWMRRFRRTPEFRAAHTNLLATPKWQRLACIEQHPPRQRPGASRRLHVAASERTVELAKHRRLKVDDDDDYDVDEDGYPIRPRPPATEGTNVAKAALHGSCTNRTNTLATPKLCNLVNTLYSFKDIRGPEFVERMEQRIKEALKNNYTTFLDRKDSEHSAKTKSTTSMRSEAEWKRHGEWLAKIATPKPIPKPRRLPKRKTRPLEQLLLHLPELARAPDRFYMKEEYKDPTKVQESALSYVISDRVKEIAKPKKFYPGPTRRPEEMVVSQAAMNYKASERLKEIAVAKPSRYQEDTDVKENPFQVSPLALTYIASPRMAVLCQPKQRA